MDIIITVTFPMTKTYEPQFLNKNTFVTIWCLLMTLTTAWVVYFALHLLAAYTGADSTDIVPFVRRQISENTPLVIILFGASFAIPKQIVTSPFISSKVVVSIQNTLGAMIVLLANVSSQSYSDWMIFGGLIGAFSIFIRQVIFASSSRVIKSWNLLGLGSLLIGAAIALVTYNLAEQSLYIVEPLIEKHVFTNLFGEHSPAYPGFFNSLGFFEQHFKELAQNARAEFFIQTSENIVRYLWCFLLLSSGVLIFTASQCLKRILPSLQNRSTLHATALMMAMPTLIACITLHYETSSLSTISARSLLAFAWLPLCVLLFLNIRRVEKNALSS